MIDLEKNLMNNVIKNSWIKESIESIEEGLKFILSWIVLTFIAIIVGGKFLSQVFPQFACPKQLLRIAFKQLIDVGATDIEVIYGFGGFILTFFSLSTYAGNDIYLIVKHNFGIDPGHFSSLSIFCSFATVTWSFSLYMIFILFNRIYRSITRDISSERDKLIDKLSHRNNHG